VLGGFQKLSGNSSSSLAVFYVEQVALNRHVSPQQRAPFFMLEKQGDVKNKAGEIKFKPTNWHFGASNDM
jgi:hypothetical protein